MLCFARVWLALEGRYLIGCVTTAFSSKRLAQFSQNGSILKTVRVISRKAIVGFRRVHKDAEGPLDAWYRTVLRARWRNLAQARMDFPHADAVGERTAFNIAGNKYRLTTRVNYRTQRVFILAVLTHAEYDKGAWKK